MFDLPDSSCEDRVTINKRKLEMIKVDSQDAEKLLKKRLMYSNTPTDYIATFRTASGREIALERERTEGFFVWLHKYTTEINGIDVENEKYPGKPYTANQGRNSTLNEKNTPKLKPGKKVWYLKVDNIEALENLIDWYCKQ